jgi:hypothetical protein
MAQRLLSRSGVLDETLSSGVLDETLQIESPSGVASVDLSRCVCM